MWFSWKNKERAWTELEIPCDKTDSDLFYASTVVTVGKGDLAKFWFSAWLNGKQARHLAPNLYKKAIRKNISVQQALKANTWIKHVVLINTEIEVKEYMDLCKLFRRTVKTTRTRMPSAGDGWITENTPLKVPIGFNS